MPHRSELRWGITSVRFGTVSAGHLRPRRTAIVPPAATIANAPRPAARAAVLSDCGATRSVSTFGPAVEVGADEVGIGDVVVEVGAGVVVVLVVDGDVDVGTGSAVGVPAEAQFMTGCVVGRPAQDVGTLPETLNDEPVVEPAAWTVIERPGTRVSDLIEPPEV